MSKIYCCVGRYATNPYTIKNVSIRVYCVEELCYYIRHNALFIEDDFFEPSLLLWLEEECDLQGLARKIKVKLRSEGGSSAAVKELFSNVNYCDEKETEETIMLLRSNRDMSSKERLMIHGDFFLSNNRISLAAETYQELLPLLDKKKDIDMLAKVYYNLGVIFARLFMYENAGEYFKSAYELNGDKNNLTMYLMTLRLRLSDEAYLKKLQSIDGAYECSALVENNLENALNMYKDSEEPLKIKELQKLKYDGSVNEFGKRALKIASSYKDEYRFQMQK